MLAFAGDIDTVMNDVALIAHAFVPAVAGAVVVTVFELTTTSAVSCRPISSVTVSRTVYDPELGATTVAVSVLLPEIEVEPLTTVHA